MTDSRLTRLLQDVREGEDGARERLIEEVYQELRTMARQQFGRESAGHTLQPTALVAEAWMRLEGNDVGYESRAHFFGAAAHAMRCVLIDHARKNRALKRGGDRVREALTGLGGLEGSFDVIDVDDALTALAARDEDLAAIVELRFFAGLSVAEVAEIRGLSTATVKRHWTYARAWLYDRMKHAD